MTVPLSGRIRPNSEAAPWVLEEIKTLEAEVERLREAARQVHALAENGVSLGHSALHTAWGALAEIHEITKGMVE